MNTRMMMYAIALVIAIVAMALGNRALVDENPWVWLGRAFGFLAIGIVILAVAAVRFIRSRRRG